MRRLIALLFAASAAFAQQPATGALTENVATRSDAAETYTLYLPKAYDGTRKLPLLLIFDPRGRATLAAEIFRPAAEELGWILISSGNTQSDDDGAANQRALRALIPETSRYAVDSHRIYATGFSGTAMLSWLLGIQSGGLAGVIGVGGRLVDGIPPAKFSFAHYGFAGDADFNNREMRAVDAALEEAGKVHRFEQFPGPHRWMPTERARDAMRWMDVVAMKESRVKRDDAFIAAALADDLAAAAALERETRLLEAMRRFEAIVRTYDGLADVTTARAAAQRLAADPTTRAQRTDEARWDDYERQFVRDVFEQMATIFGAYRVSGVAPTASELAGRFRVPELEKHAAKSGAERAAARRLLEAVFAQSAFYLPRQFADRHEYAYAAATLAVAARIHPDDGDVWYALGSAHARNGDRRATFAALTKAIDLGFKDAAALASNPAFAGLRDDARYRAIVARIAH